MYPYIGRQTLSRPARPFQLGRLYNFVDIDISDPHPSFSAHVVRRIGAHSGLVDPLLGKYGGNREEMLAAARKSYTYIGGGGFVSNADAVNLFLCLLNGGAVGGRASALCEATVDGGSSAVSWDFVAGPQRSADALCCPVHVIRPNLVKLFVENRRDRPYHTS